MSCACGKNKFCKCSSISVKDLDEALNRIRAFIYCDSDSFFGNKRYGFPGCRDIKLYTKLSLVSNSLARQKADIVVADSISQCLLRGEIHHAIKSGLLKEETVVELGNVIANRDLQRSSDEQITVADLTGVAVQDIQISKAVYKALS